MNNAIRVAAIDDHPIFLSGLDTALGRMKEVVLIAKGASAADAALIAARFNPDIMLMDIGMPGGGIEATRAIAASGTSVRVIILTASDDDERVSVAIQSGAHGYLVKGVVASELLLAIKVVHSGQPYITPTISSRLLLQKMRGPTCDVTMTSQQAKLTHREQAIIDLVVQGFSNQEIADNLNLAQSTVKNYLSRVFDKLQVRSRTQAMAAFARR